MLPKSHLLIGVIFSIAIYFFIDITILQGGLILFSSVFIDFDHYLWYIKNKKSWNLKKAYYYLKNKKTHQKTLMIFHTIEFHILITLLSFVWMGFLYVLIGMLFHSTLDIVDMSIRDRLEEREFSLINYLVS